MDKGWIKLNRQIQDHWIWKNHEFAYAWIDLLLMVNRTEKKILVDNKLITIKRGQTLTSIKKLADRWGWSRKKVYSFLGALEKDRMMVKKSTSRYTTLTIVNYGKFQDHGNSKGNTQGTSVGTTEEQQRVHKQEYIKKEKEYKEAEPPTLDELAPAEEDEEPPVPGAVRMANGGWNYTPGIDWDAEDEKEEET